MLRNAQNLSEHWRISLGLVTGWTVLSWGTALPAREVARHPVIGVQESALSWRSMTAEEEARAWDDLFNSPLGIAAFNQLAIEGFISPICPKTFYTNDEFGGFQFIVRVQCPDERGVSTAVGYREIRVVFNRFESNIENFSIERVGEETPPTIPLP